MKKKLFQLECVDVSFGDKKALAGINFQINSGEHWAVIGGNGAGKSTLLKLIRGDVWPDQGSKGKRVYNLNGEEQSTPIGVKEKIAIVSAEKQDAYSKQNFFLNCESVIHTGFFDSVWLQQHPDKEQKERTDLIIDHLDIEHLRKKAFKELSRGDARKVLIARALVNRPVILILDEFCSGLDRVTINKLLEFVDQIARNEVQILFTTHRMEEILPVISHALLLKDGVVISSGKRDEVLTEQNLSLIFGRSLQSKKMDLSAWTNNSAPVNDSGKPLENMITVKDVDVYISRKKVLSGLNWQMKTDENWVVLGKNGAGKSTFLGLICGDIVPALGGQVCRFGEEEMGHILDLKKRIGHVSADLQSGYSHNLTGEDVVLSGFSSSIGLWDDISKEKREIAEKWIEYFNLEDIAKKKIHTMSYGQSRKILIARAMVHDPDILVLDEPCDGLDMQSRVDFIDAIGKLCQARTKIIYATHHIVELIPQISHALLLDKGEILVQGAREEVLKHFNDGC